MLEPWLLSNRRFLKFGLLPPALFAVIGLVFITQGFWGAIPWWIASLGGVLSVFGVAGVAGLLMELQRPRIGYREGTVFFFLRSGPPIATPLEVVEAFFLGQGPAKLPGSRISGAETVNLIARLAEKATEWQKVEVKPVLGHWCDGYVTIRGTHCELLGEDLVRQLNHKLVTAKRSYLKDD
jgi:hypothetical protein